VFPFAQSIRWRLPLTYAGIAALAAVCLGAALLVTLRSYYAEREHLHLENNARAVSHLVQRLQMTEASPDEMMAQISNLAFITQARIRIINPDDTLLVDTGSPSNMLTFGYTALEDTSDTFTITASNLPPEPDIAEPLPDIIFRTAGQPEIAAQYTIGATTAPPYDTLRIDREGRTAWFSSSTEVALTPPELVTEPVQIERPFNRPYLMSLAVSATPYGFGLIDEMNLDVRSSQMVRLPLRSSDGTPAGFVELSEGASFGAQIIENVTIALFFAEALAILIAALVGWVMSRQISQPVLSLTQGAEQMAQGKLATRVMVAGQDEFAKLARTFNEMAEQVEGTVASLRRFVADAAHELHTPLTALHADLELAATEADENRRRVYLARARAQAHLLELLTNNLLDLSRLESKTREAPFRPVDVTQLVHDLSEVAASRAEQVNLQFQVEAPDEPVYVVGDELQLRRAVLNLLDNAIKFTPEGGTVGISVQRSVSTVNIVVNDTGIGIPTDDLPQLFSRFHRGRNANHYPGSGLGLAIIRAIVDGHRGQIEVRSTPGDTRFTVRIPVVV
jgi:signal transduction histidine kinase